MAGIGEFVGTVSPQAVRLFCSVLGQDWIPYPFLSYPGRDVTLEQLEAEFARIRQDWDHEPPREFDDWARTSIRPDLRIEAVATDPRPDVNPTKKSIRVNGVRRHDLGFVAVQETEDGIPSGDISVYAMNAVDLGRAVVDAMPTQTVATEPVGDLFLLEPAQERRQSLYDDERSDDWDAELRRVLGSEICRSGFVQVRDGRANEWKLDSTASRLIWADYQEFGRYLWGRGESALAVNRQRMISELNAVLGTLVDAIRERRGG
ncbi:hypothetical protein AAFP30_22180 [Gordonia sp. CPCC 205515]|uniref:ESX secretion-associated protein EspG n=1 Tax=Gordonia sp. CPCC 205515 TaxID=3140791 RepID=UPI003AF39A4F